MIDIEKLKLSVVKGLREFLEIPIIRSNQNITPPDYPYASYTITTVVSKNNGSWGVYDDGIERIPITQTWSFTIQSNDNNESVMLANKAKNWLENIGRTYLNDNNIIVQSIGNITNRDNIISIEYEYKNGFDVVFYLFDEVQKKIEAIEAIEFK